jgi:nicotinamidase-related amidase
MSDINLDREHTSLLIGDCYADAMTKLSHSTSRRCVEKTVALREAARKAELLICYSATVFRPGYLEINERNKLFAPRKHLGLPAASDPVALIHPALKPDDGEPVVSKHRVNAFFGTDLEIILSANHVNTLILVGYATSGVILSTTRYAADADYRVIVVEDCCTDRDAAVHDFLCQKIFPFQADVVQSADLIRALSVR